MIWDELKLLEECDSESAAEQILAKLSRRAQLATREELFDPSYLYTIEYRKRVGGSEKVEKFQVVANSWSWKDRHKWFFVHTPASEAVKVAEFYCDKEDFIQQTCRMCSF
jgi:hypothetical protein